VVAGPGNVFICNECIDLSKEVLTYDASVMRGSRSGRTTESPSNPRFLRLLLAYIVGLNAFGLVLALTFAVSNLAHLPAAVGLIGAVIAIAAGVAAGWRTERAIKRVFT
jgi:hypothetical protein